MNPCQRIRPPATLGTSDDMQVRKFCVPADAVRTPRENDRTKMIGCSAVSDDATILLR